jgi:hypothetical protein
MTNRAALIFTVASLFACGRSNRAASTDSTSLATSATSADTLTSAQIDTTPGHRAPTCPRTGLWALCSVEKRLKQSGFVLRKAALPAPKRAGFSVMPTTYLLGSARLEVFIYPDAKSLAADWTNLDTLRASPRGTTTTWPTPPTLVRSENLAALFLSESPEKADRLSLAITAGAPQPGTRRSANQALLPAVHIVAPTSKQPR